MDSEEFQRLKAALPKLPKLNWGIFKIIFLVLVTLVGIITSVYTIPPESVGVVTRFGEYSKNSDPGLRWKLPFFIDQVVRRFRSGDNSSRSSASAPPGATNGYQSSRGQIQESEKSMVTGDSNVALVEWVVQYHHRGRNVLSSSRCATRMRPCVTPPSPSCVRWSGTGPSMRSSPLDDRKSRPIPRQNCRHLSTSMKWG